MFSQENVHFVTGKRTFGGKLEILGFVHLLA